MLIGFNRKFDIKYLWFLVIFLCFYTGNSRSAEEREAWVSLVNLIATPERFHDKRVMVSGFVYIERENHVICLTRSPPSGKECLWLEIFPRRVATEEDFDEYSEEVGRWISDYHLRLVTIKGRFDMHNDGHLSNQSGSIKEITLASAENERMN